MAHARVTLKRCTPAVETAAAAAPAGIAPAEHASVRDGPTYCSSNPKAPKGNVDPAAAISACDASTQSACCAAFSVACSVQKALAMTVKFPDAEHQSGRGQHPADSNDAQQPAAMSRCIAGWWELHKDMPQ